MNERIRELAEQAGFSLVDIRNAFYDNEDNPYLKFAELIVRECIMLQYRRGVEGFGIAEEQMIKQHFGVE